MCLFLQAKSGCLVAVWEADSEAGKFHREYAFTAPCRSQGLDMLDIGDGLVRSVRHPNPKFNPRSS